MAETDDKISELASATLPLTGFELVMLVQGGVTKKTPLNTTVILASYTVATLPLAPVDGTLVYVTDEVDGPVPAFADGGAWRRVTDRAIVSVSP